MSAPLFLAPLLCAQALSLPPAPADQVNQPAPPPPVSIPKPPAANLVFAQVFGNGLLYSVNYERLFVDGRVGVRGGTSFFTWAVSSYGGSSNLTLVSFPVVASYYVGGFRHKLQLGLGATLLYLDASSDSQQVKFSGDRAGLGLAATAVVGYRYLPRDGGFSFGIGFTPLLRPGSLLPWGGADVGYAF